MGVGSSNDYALISTDNPNKYCLRRQTPPWRGAISDQLHNRAPASEPPRMTAQRLPATQMNARSAGCDKRGLFRSEFAVPITNLKMHANMGSYSHLGSPGMSLSPIQHSFFPISLQEEIYGSVIMQQRCAKFCLSLNLFRARQFPCRPLSSLLHNHCLQAIV